MKLKIKDIIKGIDSKLYSGFYKHCFNNLVEDINYNKMHQDFNLKIHKKYEFTWIGNNYIDNKNAGFIKKKSEI